VCCWSLKDALLGILVQLRHRHHPIVINTGVGWESGGFEHSECVGVYCRIRLLLSALEFFHEESFVRKEIVGAVVEHLCSELIHDGLGL